MVFDLSSTREDVLDHAGRAFVGTLYCCCHPLEDLGVLLELLCMRLLVLAALRANDSLKDWISRLLLAK